MEEDQGKQIDTERETLLIKTNERKYIMSERDLPYVGLAAKRQGAAYAL